MTPTEDLDAAKVAFRSRARAARAGLGDDDRMRAHAAIAARVLALPEIGRAEAVMLYGAAPDEVDVSTVASALRARGARTFLPRVAGDVLDVVEVDDDTPLTPGFKGILEPDGDPADPRDIDVVVVPGLAFDDTGHRLGQGRAFYDRLLPQIDGVRVGVAYDQQVVDDVPADAGDQRMDVLVTPTRTLRFAR